MTADISPSEPVWIEPWEHPDWYDLHAASWTAGVEREEEHYRELVLALPPLDRADHLVDVGAGTGRAAKLVAEAYPNLARVTLVEPNQLMLRRALERLRHALPDATVEAVAAPLGEGVFELGGEASVAVAASVLMPSLEAQGGSLAEALDWLWDALAELRSTLRPGGRLLALDTLDPSWSGGGGLEDPVRRLTLPEYMAALEDAGFTDVECVYRFRDRVVVSATAEEEEGSEEDRVSEEGPLKEDL